MATTAPEHMAARSVPGSVSGPIALDAMIDVPVPSQRESTTGMIGVSSGAKNHRQGKDYRPNHPRRVADSLSTHSADAFGSQPRVACAI
jgi:hypothetical protein